MASNTMGRREKRLESMRANPRDWSKDDVKSLCDSYDISCRKPDGTSHFTVSDPTQSEILTIVQRKPIKQVYIKKLVAFVDAVQAAREAQKGDDDEA